MITQKSFVRTSVGVFFVWSNYFLITEQYDEMVLKLKRKNECLASVSRRNEDLARDNDETLVENVRLSSEFADKRREFDVIKAENESLNKILMDQRTIVQEKTKENELLLKQLQKISEQKNEGLETLNKKYRRLLDLIGNFRKDNLSSMKIFVDDKYSKPVEISPTPSVNEEKLTTSSDDDQTKRDLAAERDRLAKLCASLKRKCDKFESEIKGRDKKMKKYRRRCDDLEAQTKSLKRKLRRQKDSDGPYGDILPELEKIQAALSNLNHQIGSAANENDLNDQPLRESSYRRGRSRSPAARPISPLVRRRRSEVSLTHSNSSTEDEEREAGNTQGDSRTAVDGYSSPTPAAFRKPARKLIKFKISAPKHSK